MRSYTPPADVRMVQVGALKLACLEWGTSGPLVLLVHGFPDTARSWDQVGPLLAEAGFRVVAPFTRGVAPSQIPADGAYDADTLGGDLLGLIEALGEERALVVGHDFGAAAAYAAAGLAPERLIKLVTVAIPHPATLKPNLSLAWGARHFLTLRLPGAAGRFAKGDFHGMRVLYERWSPTHDWPDEEFEAARNSYSAPGSCAAALSYYRFINAPSKGMAARISTSTLIIGGREDGVAREENFEASRSRFTGEVQVVMVPGGHFLHREHLQPFMDQLLPFLKG